MGENQVQQGLYSQSFEHDNCGIGAVVNIKGRKDVYKRQVSGGSQTIRFAQDPKYVYPTACEIELECRIKKGAATFCRSTFAMLAV